MVDPLTDEEIQRLRVLINGVSLDNVYAFSGFIVGLAHAAKSPSDAYQVGNRMAELAGFSHYGPIVQNLWAQAAQLVDIARLLGPYAQRLANLAMENPPESTLRQDMQNEIGALKTELGQAVSAINESMVTVQGVIDTLREEHELVSVTRHLTEDPEWGKFA